MPYFKKKYKKFYNTFLTLLLCLVVWFGVARAQGLIFDPNFAISDVDATNANDMDRQHIQNFLEEKHGRIAYYEALTKEGDIKTASSIIDEAGNKYQISKRFLLVMIQKEQRLITNDNPLQSQFDWVMGYALCDVCSVDDPQIQRWKGFAQQINSAAAQFRDYFDNPQNYPIKIGQTYSIDGQSVTPQNQATANLYIYTPHLVSAKSFFRIWNDWFGPSEIPLPPPPKPLPYPDGALLTLAVKQPLTTSKKTITISTSKTTSQIKKTAPKTNKNKSVKEKSPNEAVVWYIKNRAKHKILSKDVLTSRFDDSKIIQTTQAYLDKYTEGTPVSFPQHALVKDEIGNTYLLIHDSKRLISSPEVFYKMGFQTKDVLMAKKSDLQGYSEGLPLTVSSTYAIGALLQDKKGGGVFYVEAGIKHPLVDRVILDLDFFKTKIMKISSTELTTYMTGDPYTLQDGYLIQTKGDPNIYLLSNGQRRPFLSLEVFMKLGYDKKKIINVPNNVAEIHAIGEPLTGE